MGIKTLLFLCAIGVVAFISLMEVAFHFAIAGALVWDGNVCPNDEFFSKCVQLHAYIAATWLVVIVETLMITFSMIALGLVLFYYFTNIRTRNGYTQLESNTEKQFGHVCTKCQKSEPAPSFSSPNEHLYSVNGGAKYNTMV